MKILRKKIFLSMFGFILTTVIIYSCNKQKLDIDSNISEGVSIKDGRYVFSNRVIFESYVKELGKMTDEQLNDIDKKLNFKSRRLIQNSFEPKNENPNLLTLKTQSQNSNVKTLIVPNQYQLEEVIDDQGFASVLNEEFILQIDEDIFKVNMIDGYVYVMDQNNQQYLPQLEDSQLEPNAIYRYRMGLPILDILDAGNLGTDPCSIDPYYCSVNAAPSNPPGCFSCNDPAPSTPLCDKGQSFENGVCNGCAGTNHRKVQPDDKIIERPYSAGGVLKIQKIKFESKIAYQPLGIWFSMISKLKAVDVGSFDDPNYYSNGNSSGHATPSTPIEFKILNRSQYNFRKRCKNRETGSEDEGNGFSKVSEKAYRFYNGTRCLKDYCVTSTMGYFDDYQSNDFNYKGLTWVLNLTSD
jgi:hypothetical protein